MPLIALLDQLSMGAYELDGARIVRHANRRLSALLGRPAEALVGLPFIDLVPPEERTAVLRGSARAAALGRPYVRRLRLEGPAGPRPILLREVALADDAGGIRHVGTIEDLSEQQRLEDSVGASEQLFQQLIEESPDGIAVYTDARLVYVNPALVRLVGYPSAEALLGKRLSELVDCENDSTISQRIRRTLAPGASRRHEERFRRLDGTPIDVELNALQTDYRGAPSMLLIVRDVTERKQMQAQLIRAERLASVGTLAAGVAHEINNPLAYAIANLDFVRESIDAMGESALPAELRDALSEAAQGAERVRRIVRDLGMFARPESEEKKPVEVHGVLEASINVAWNQLRHRAHLRRDYGAVSPVLANEVRLGQVVVNLLINAAHAIPVGHASANEVRLSTSQVGERVVIEVSDTGGGIAPEHLERIFDPFFTTKPVGIGTGLGLSICHGIITSLGGRIEVRSCLGRGTTVSVSLPAARGATAPQDGKRAAAPVEPARILIVDDEPAIVRALQRRLAPHRVESALGGRPALELLERDRGFDVVLCDLMMPDLTGMDLHALVQQRWPELAERFVFMTGGAFTARAREFLEQVKAPRLDKPVDMRALLELIERLRVRAPGARRHLSAV